MPDFLLKLIENARRRIAEGYYNTQTHAPSQYLSLKSAIKSSQHNAVIAEIKPISPARGALRPDIDPINAAVKLERAGAVALSVLTEPDNFGGKLDSLAKIRPHVTIPLLMKDIVIAPVQIEAARKLGADSVLLIESSFSQYGVANLTELIGDAHDLKLEVLLEVHSETEFERAMDTEADVVGVNNRNLSTLEIDLGVTEKILSNVVNNEKVLITESGIESGEDIQRLKSVNVNGFLVGSSIMLSDDMPRKLRELIYA